MDFSNQQQSVLFLLLLCLVSLWIALAEEAQCVMYGQCGEGDYGTLNCAYNGPPKIVDDAESIELLKQTCPEYVKDDKALTCCDANQISQLDANFKLPQRLLGRCPACFANFRTNFCRLTCSPTQSDYLIVSKSDKNDEGKDMVNEIVYFINSKYVSGLFDSCKEVEGIIPGTRVIDLMCGRHASKCNGPTWLEFMGSTPDNSGFSPVQINYTITDDSKVEMNGKFYFPMNESTVRCSESPEPGQGVCDCSDCAEACKKPATTTTASPVKAPNSNPISASGNSTNKNGDDKALAGSNNEKIVATETSSLAEEGKTNTPLSKFFDKQLFRRVLSPLIVIAPAFSED